MFMKISLSFNLPIIKTLFCLHSFPLMIIFCLMFENLARWKINFLLHFAHCESWWKFHLQPHPFYEKIPFTFLHHSSVTCLWKLNKISKYCCIATWITLRIRTIINHLIPRWLWFIQKISKCSMVKIIDIIELQYVTYNFWV